MAETGSGSRGFVAHVLLGLGGVRVAAHGEGRVEKDRLKKEDVKVKMAEGRGSRRWKDKKRFFVIFVATLNEVWEMSILVVGLKLGGVSAAKGFYGLGQREGDFAPLSAWVLCCDWSRGSLRCLVRCRQGRC